MSEEVGKRHQHNSAQVEQPPEHGRHGPTAGEQPDSTVVRKLVQVLQRFSVVGLRLQCVGFSFCVDPPQILYCPPCSVAGAAVHHGWELIVQDRMDVFQ